MKRTTFVRKTIGVLLFSSLLSSCSDLDDYYDAPSWMGGSIYQELQDEGNYSIFLKGVQLSGWEAVMNGKSIVTVMAPNDEAMTAYLQENYHTTDISQVEIGELKKLIGYHILYYAFDKDKLINFRPLEGDGATEDEKNINAGLYYKFRTHSQAPISTAFDKTRQKDVKVYHNEQMLPVFSHRMFQTKGIDAKENYEYFFPQTGWKGEGGFNVANAAVTEYAKIGRNGYIYKIDRVLKPMNTIYQELKAKGNFTRILSLYDNSEYYEADAEMTIETASSDTLYHHYHKLPLVNIDSEWGDVMSYMSVGRLASTAYSIFAPTDEAFQNFFNDYWGQGGYTSIEDIDSVTMQELMRNCVYPANIAFPGEIKNGKIKNIDDEVISFDPDKVPASNRMICSNGVVYGCTELTPPAKFRAVTGPAFQYKDYTNFNEMLSGSSMAATLIQDAVKYVMLYPTNEQMYNAQGIERKDGVLISNAAPKGMSKTTMTNYILSHVSSPIDDVTALPKTGVKVLPTLSDRNKIYIYVKDGKLTNSIQHNKRLKYAANTATDDQIWAPFAPLKYLNDENGWSNGNAYSYDNLLLPGDYSTELETKMVSLMISNRNDATTEFYGWINLLIKAELTNNSAGKINFMLENCLMLIPTTEALEKAIVGHRVPGVEANGATVGSDTFFDNITITDSEALTNYVKNYFVPLSTASINEYPYVGWGEDTKATSDKGLITYRQTLDFATGNVTASKINIYETPEKTLEVTLTDYTTGIEGEKRVKVYGGYDFLPFIFEDGPVQLLEDVF